MLCKKGVIEDYIGKSYKEVAQVDVIKSKSGGGVQFEVLVQKAEFPFKLVIHRDFFNTEAYKNNLPLLQ